MPRIARAVAVGFPHHITQRGNYRQAVFETDRDYIRYLELLKQYSEQHSLKVWAYCLMGNHVHFIAVPMEPDSLSKAFNALHMRYSQYFNRKNKTMGHLWQGRFYSCALDERHLYAAMRYVENNPVRAQIVRKAEKYQWSSARSHVMKVVDPVISKDCYLIKEIKDWPAYLREKDDRVLVEELRQNTTTGRPCGDEKFIGKLEKSLGRRLGALPWGRPRKRPQ
ncbi:MAG: transposase [Actinomycetota bacterium]|nr:transposase [Nitrospiraceae bacterium]MDA8155279.1 transposase [Actinomycetota bacterium]